MRPELGIVEEPEERARSIVPDVLILRQPHQTQGPGAGGILVRDAPQRQVAPAVEFGTLPDEPVRHHFVEIRDSQRGHKLVTNERGPYRRGAVDYSQSTQSLASAEDAAWADALLREQGWRSNNG